MGKAEQSFQSVFGLIVLCFLTVSCQQSTSTESTEEEEEINWLLPADKILDGGPGQDGIPSLDSPVFAPVNEIDYVQDNRKVLGVSLAGVEKAYPLQVLDWHEIVNDRVGSRQVTISHCPLTGTGIGYNRIVKNRPVEFGVSGLIYKNNLIPYDRFTSSNWSQMQMRAVSGEMAGTLLEPVTVVETTWKTWKEMYPDSQVLTTETGFVRLYDKFVYGRNYSTSHSQFLFPVENFDERLPNKEPVHAVLLNPEQGAEAMVRVYPIGEFAEDIEVMNDSIGDHRIVVAGSSGYSFATAFRSTLDDGTELIFEAVQNSLPIVMEDQEGNRWTLFGRAVEGPRSGSDLPVLRSYTGYWFAFADMFSNVEISDEFSSDL